MVGTRRVERRRGFAGGSGRATPAESDHDRLGEEVFERLARIAGLRPGGAQPASRPADAELSEATSPRPSGGPIPVAVPENGDLERIFARFSPGRRGVLGLAVVVGLAVAVAGFLTWRGQPRPVPVASIAAATPAGSAGGGGDAAGGGVDSAAGSRSTTPGPMVVAVAGKVRRPGLVRLPPGARVADAIEAAGGALPETDLACLNLARKLVDGELVLVGVSAPAGLDQGTGQVPAGGGPGGGKVNINSASLAELQTLPGIGPVLAQRIIDFRTTQGDFRALSDLRKVEGLGATRVERLKELVTL